ncbi:DUF3626 domain-containing protein [Streptomyces sp. NBC_00083]|uniref:DUF3626 domain-containing protein n=1 Tax=Streptomyces sp. NBC_00083 TaxID=2975647 RepID=UPI00225326F9|nr:DUF3626 domain-containing protein [Streptomyces sp. NBC_00083]MCX5385631.1 DUF3626 domain-containing protein [Streptomyces sp. NBC_00083]
MSLTPAQAGALGHVRAAAQEARVLAEKRLCAVRPGTRVDDVTAYVMDSARITLNFHPDRLRPRDGRTVAEALAADGVYRSQYETGLSNGGRTAFPGGARDEWERGLFGGAYHRAGVRPEERPKYGALDLAGHTDGAAPRFGSCHVRLRPEVNARATFCHGDSHLGPADVGTSDAFASVLAALAEDGTPVAGPDADAPPAAGPAAAARGHGRVLDGYVEAQVHGPVVLARDAEALVLDPSFRGTGTARLLAATGVPVEWHPGFVLAPHEVDAAFRGPVMVPLAEWICRTRSPHGLLDARVLGHAAASAVREPREWARWGTPDEMLQYVKQLWHVLAWSGRPETRPEPGA